MIQQPGGLKPYRQAKRALARGNVVLGAMVDTHHITEAQAQALQRVPLVVCHDLFPSPASAIAHYVLPGASWQRCRTHFMRNLLTRVPKAAQAMVATLVRTIFAQSDKAQVKAQFDRVLDQLEPRGRVAWLVNVGAGFQNAVGANSLIDDGGGPKVSGSTLMIFKVDGGAVWKCASSCNGTSTTSTSRSCIRPK